MKKSITLVIGRICHGDQWHTFLWFSKRNLFNRFEKNKKYYSNFYSGWEKNYNNKEFNLGYDQKKIVQFEYNGKTKLSTNFFKELLEYVQKIFSNNKKYNYRKILVDNSKLDKSQEEAFIFILNNKTSILSAPAGYGKTFLIRQLIDEFSKRKEKTIFLALTHKATRILNKNNISKEYLEIKTIRKITWSPSSLEELKNYKNIIIDEISMIDDSDWYKILRKINYIHDLDTTTNKRIILIGDENQLPPLFSPGLHKIIFRDYEKSKVNLEKNYRHKDNESLLRFVEFYGKNKKNNNDNSFLDTYSTLSEYVNLIEKFNDGTWQFLSPKHNTSFGINGINNLIGDEDYDDFKEKDYIIIDTHFQNSNVDITKCIYSGKKMMIKYIKNGIYEFEEVVDDFKTINKSEGWFIEDHKLFYETQDGIEVPFSKSSAITIHKSQGSTFPKVCLVIPPGNTLSDELMYTAISRASRDLKILIFESDIKKYIDLP